MIELFLLFLGAGIHIDNGNVIAIDEKGIIYNGTEPIQAFKRAFVNNTSLTVARGIYDFKNNTLDVPSNTTIDGYSISSSKLYATTFKFDNGGMMIINDFTAIDKIRISGQNKTDYSTSLLVYGHDNQLGNVFVFGSPKSIGVTFYQSGTKYNFDNHIDKLYVTNAYQGIRFDHVTQNYFAQVVLTSIAGQGMIFIESDHNHFDHVHNASPSSPNEIDIIMGIKKGDVSVGNTFNSLTVNVNHVNIVSNSYILKRPNIIQVLEIDGTAKIVYNNNSTGSIKINDYTAWQ